MGGVQFAEKAQTENKILNRGPNETTNSSKTPPILYAKYYKNLSF